MVNDPTSLADLPRSQLLAMAREALGREAEKIYAPEALLIVMDLFNRNTEAMGCEQLAHIVVNMEAA